MLTSHQAWGGYRLQVLSSIVISDFVIQVFLTGKSEYKPLQIEMFLRTQYIDGNPLDAVYPEL